MLTKELKAQWLEKLKSGKYERYTGSLVSKSDPNKMCCLGVLATCLPNTIIIAEGTGLCFVNGINEGYEPFFGLLGACRSCRLTTLNDDSTCKDYSAVIPMIEELETID